MSELLRACARSRCSPPLRHRPEHRCRRGRPPRTVARPARGACFDPDLAGWNGIGFVVQGYQKRCPFVIDYLIDLARRSRHRLMIRLVKAHTGIPRSSGRRSTASKAIRSHAQDLHRRVVRVREEAARGAGRRTRSSRRTTRTRWPRSTSSRARTTTRASTNSSACIGMGEPLYEEVTGRDKLNRPCRVRTGRHARDAARVRRRLLENGANTSFVNRIADKTVSVKELVADPVDEASKVVRSARAAREDPAAQPVRRRASQLDGPRPANEHRLASLSSALLASAHFVARGA